MTAVVLLAWSALVACGFEPRSIDDAPRPARRAHVIVVGIDREFSWRSPFRPEPYWPVGAEFFRYFDHDIVVAHGKDVADLVRRLEAQLTADGFGSIGRIEIWTHGGPGYFRIQERRLTAGLFTRPNGPTADALRTLRSWLAFDAVVHFRSCCTFHGPRGYAIAQAASRFFNQTGKRIVLMGHTRPTGLTHPGWKTLRPDRRPDWSLDEGRTEAPLEGVQILVRDLLAICTGQAYEAVPTVLENAPSLLARAFEDSCRATDLLLAHARDAFAAFRADARRQPLSQGN